MLSCEILHKANYLNTHSNKIDSNYLQILQSIIKRASEENRSKGYLRFIAFELAYLFERHNIWIKTPAFKHIATTYIQNNFHLTRLKSESLIELIDQRFYSKTKCNYQDSDFYRYLVISSLEASDRVTWSYDLSVGPELLNIIKDSIERKRKPETKSAFIEFSVDVVDQIDQAVNEVFTQMEINPNYIEIYKLHYSLLEHSNPEIISFNINQINLIFECLYFLGTKQTSNINAIYKHISTYINKKDCSFDVKKILSILLDQELIYLEGNKNNSQQKFFLTKKAYKLTATTFGIRHKDHRFNKKLFCSIPSVWQTSWIQLVHKNALVSFKDFLTEVQIIPSSVISAYISRISSSFDHDEACRILHSFVNPNNTNKGEIKKSMLPPKILRELKTSL